LCPSAVGGDDTFSVQQYTSGTSQAPSGPAPYSPAILLAHSHYVTNAGVNQPWGRSTPYSYNFDLPEPMPGLPADIINGPFYRNSRTRVASVTDGLSNTVFLGEHSSSISDSTWVGVVPFACTPPKPGVPSDPNSGGCLVGAHSGPDIHDHPQV